jgi:hypothetical protein
VKICPDNLSIYQIFTDIGVPTFLVFLAKWVVGKLAPPYKEVQVLLNQVNAYHSNIYGRFYSRKNGSLHVRFMNRKSLRPNKKYSCAFINLSRNADGTYHVLSDYPVTTGQNLSPDQLREEFTSLWCKQAKEDFVFAVHKFVEIGEKKGIVKNSVWTDGFGLITSLPDYQPNYCFVEGVNFCYVLSHFADAKISIRVLPLSWCDSIRAKTNLAQAISVATMIVNKFPDWIPQFLKDKLFVYYPWGCNVSDVFKAIRYWEKTWLLCSTEKS